MGDSTPLLSRIDSIQNAYSTSTVDDVIEEYIGGCGYLQFLQAFLVSLAWIFEAQQTFITIFADDRPSWHCVVDQFSNISTTCNSGSNICELPANSWAWDKPAYTSTVSEWSLQCTNSFLANLPSSALFAGSLFGGFIFVMLADSLGRKNLLSFSCFTMSMAAFLTIFSTNMWIYSLLRFISGIGRPIIGSCVVVLSTELVGKKWRSHVGIIGFFFSTFGFVSLPVIGYLTRDLSWRILYLCTSIPSILYCILLYFFVFESPRWLLLQGRQEDAMAILKKFLPKDYESLNLSMFPTQERQNPDILSSIKLLLGRKWALKRLLVVMAVVFGSGLTYYGIPLSVGNLSVNLYLSTILNGLMEIPATLLALFLLRRWKRKTLLLVFNTISGLCSIMCAMVGDTWKEVQLGLEVLSFLTTCIVLNVLVVYVLELFPTRIRNSTTSMMRQAQVLSGVVCPVLIAAGKHNLFLSYGIFGFLSIFLGLFVVFLPNTDGAIFCDTMDEQENMERAAALDKMNCV